MFNSFNNLISHNTISDHNQDGIAINSAGNNTVSFNIVHNNFEGIGIVSGSRNNIIDHNTVHNNPAFGVYLKEESGKNRISNNVIQGNNLDGIWLESCDENTIINNSVHDNDWTGIKLGHSSNNNVIFKNNVYNNGEFGFWLGEGGSCDENLISNNTFHDNNWNEIKLESSFDNTISNNIISHNIGYGIEIDSGSSRNIVQWNNFNDNNLGGTSQAFDYGSNNLFAFNYWDDWTSPDADTDGIVDNPYPIDGGNQDPYPLTSQYSTTIPDILTSPTLLIPNGGEFVSGIAPIQWLPVIDSLRHEVVYSINISADNGLTWEIIASGLTTTNYSWNTSTVADGSTYLMKVIAHCSEGETADDTSDGTFSVHNAPPPPPDFSLFILGLAFIPIIPELYLGRRLSKVISRKSEEGASQT